MLCSLTRISLSNHEMNNLELHAVGIAKPCHAERSEESQSIAAGIVEMFRFAQHDKEMQGNFVYIVFSSYAPGLASSTSGISTAAPSRCTVSMTVSSMLLVSM